MENKQNEQVKLNLRALVLIIFTSVFGFTNIPRSYYLMGYSAIPWYVFAAFTFFLPFALMMAEFGAAFKDEKSGIYTWMSKSMSPRYGFLVTFMWYASYIVWMVNISTSIWVVLSNAVFGIDNTQNWSLFGLPSVKTLGILGILWVGTITYVSTKGMKQIKKITSVAGTAVALINIFLIVGGVLMLILNGGSFLEPLEFKALFNSPNPEYQTSIGVLSFVVYAIFAYGGIEVMGGLVDETENPETTFPKGVVISAFIISIGYSLGILLTGSFTNWNYAFTQFGKTEVTLANVAYITMNNMGYQLGLGFGLSEAKAINIGLLVSRYMGISMFLALTGAFFTMSYSPLKQLIGGTPKEIWPKSWTKQKDGLYINAMKIQCIIVMIIIGVVSFGGKSAKTFFEMLISMTNVSMTLPYMFLAMSYIGFKKNKDIKKSFEVFKSESQAKVAVVIVATTVGFANLFTVIEPAFRQDYMTSIMSIAGPLFFSLIAFKLYSKYEKNYL